MTSGSRRARAVAIACAVALLTGCAGTDTDDGSSASSTGDTAPASSTDDIAPAPSTSPAISTTTVDPATPTPWSTALDASGPDGTFSKDAALTLFALAFGGMPGVETPPGPRGDIRSGTLALRTVLAHETELTDAQRDRLAEVRSLPDETADENPMVVEPIGFMRVPSTAPPSKPPDAAARHLLEAMGKQIRQDISARIGGDIPGVIRLVYDPRNPDAVGMADPVFTADRYSGCTVHLYQGAFDEGRDPATTIAHEMVHCFQYAAYVTEHAMDDVPGWIIEGSAEWAGASLVGPDRLELQLWPEYLTNPATDLRKRKYDAIGFYAHLDETGHSPWAAFRSMWVAGASADAVFAASGATDPAFLETWAASTTRRSPLGPEWDTTGPGITADAAKPTALSVGKQPVDVTARPYALGLYDLQINTDLVLFSIAGHGMLADGSVNTIVSDATLYCTRAGGCACPDGPSPDPPVAALDASGASLALSGGTQGTNGTVKGLDLTDICSPSTSAPAALDPCTLVSDEEVVAVLGTPIERHEPNDENGFQSCIIGTTRQPLSGFDTSQTSYVSIGFGVATISQFLDGADGSAPTTPVSSLGDEAISLDGLGAVLVSTGPVVLFVSVVQAGVPAPTEVVVGVAELALGRMR